jgi:RND superfamily putative drug exporter
VLLDTLLVRTVIVPALAFMAGEKFWWPRKLFK